MYQKTFFSLNVYNKIEWKGRVLSEPQEIVSHHTAHQLHLPLWEARSGQVRITYNTRLYEGGAWVRSVFDMILFSMKNSRRKSLLSHSLEMFHNLSYKSSQLKSPRLGNASLFCPLSLPPPIKMIKKVTRFLFPCSISSISALLVVTYVEERFWTL